MDGCGDVSDKITGLGTTGLHTFNKTVVKHK